MSNVTISTEKYEELIRRSNALHMLLEGYDGALQTIYTLTVPPTQLELPLEPVNSTLPID